MKRRGVLLAALAAATARATPVADAVDRPAVAPLASAQIARSVLLGAARAGQRLVVVGERGIAAWSDDEGRTWQQARVPVSNSLTAVRFIGDREGWASGHAGVLLHTQDGGESWGRQLDGRVAAQSALAAAQRQAATATPNDATQSARAARALQDAQRLVSDGADKPFLDLHFSDARNGLAVGAYGLAFRTADGGRTWASAMHALDNPKSLHLYAVRGAGNTRLIAGEQGLLMRSDDGGASFQRLASPYAGSWFTGEILADGSFVVAGLRGNAWRSDDRGERWRRIEGAAPISITASVLVEGQLLLGNQAGGLFISTDLGRSLRAVPAPHLPSLTALLPMPSGGLLALSLAGALALPMVETLK